jgi:hypothetical protein
MDMLETITNDSVKYLDRLLTESTAGVSSVYSGGVTTWTLPYSIAVDGSQGTLVVALADTSTVLTSTRPVANKIAVAGADYTGRPVFIGVLYPFAMTLSPIYYRDTKGLPDTTAKLTLRRLRVLCSETTDVALSVQRTGAQNTSESRSQPRAGPLDFGTTVGARNDQVRIVLSNRSPGVCAVSGFVWTGEYFPRARKV